MLQTLFLLWVISVAVSAALLVLVIAAQTAMAQLRRLTSAVPSTTPDVPAKA